MGDEVRVTLGQREGQLDSSSAFELGDSNEFESRLRQRVPNEITREWRESTSASVIRPFQESDKDLGKQGT
eukprot:scaffold1651_cov317-Pinguiococcus_pyrenoidosus.AAC.16